MQTKLPTVSIITPSFNQCEFLEYCIEKVSAQRALGGVEHIIMDGGSTDGSVEILQRMELQIDFWQSRSDKGQSDAINSGMRLASGEILTWINSDDGLADGAVDNMRLALANETSAGWCVGGCIVINDNAQVVRRWTPPRQLPLEALLQWKDNYIFQPAVFWNREMWNAVGGLEEDLHFAMDFDLWIRFFKIAPPAIIEAPIGVHRTQGASKTSMVRHEIYEEYVWSLCNRLMDEPHLKKIGLMDVARALSHRGNEAMYFGDRALAKRYLTMALKTSARTAVGDAHFWKGALKYGASALPFGN